MTKKDILDFYRNTSEKREKWNRRNSFYHKLLEGYYSFIIPEGKRVLEVGCGSGSLLNAVKPAYGLGIDFAPEVIEIARNKYPHLHFKVDDIEELQTCETFDYIILSDLISCLWDAQKAIHNVRRLCHPQTRIVISQYNFLWEPVIKLLEFMCLKQKQPNANWFSVKDTEGLLQLEGFQTIRVEKKILLPIYIPLLHGLFNGFLVNLPGFTHLGLVSLHVARPMLSEERSSSVSIIIPARNERGNIENAIKRTPDFGTHQEFIFIEGHSSDHSWEEILRVQAAYPGKDIKAMKQTGKGKGNAVREAFDAATGEVLMILDADLTMPPEELPKFYNALCSNKGEFINVCRLVYPMEKNAMRFLNLLGNKFFGWFFSYLLGQRLKDTLCGTKVLFKKDYETIKANRSYFGDFDPFGDFDLLFGAAKQNLKIVEVIIRYKDRAYGSTQISRFKHGLLLLRMSFFAMRKIKFPEFLSLKNL
ncbi:MAG: glycosyltransferase [Tannerellaceae bacterium]|jgi:SAM-dependent methyltransferase|nr:glycosyltransferase [Tannerellaceae bacterium]